MFRNYWYNSFRLYIYLIWLYPFFAISQKEQKKGKDNFMAPPAEEIGEADGC
jgi:hypothetical protein